MTLKRPESALIVIYDATSRVLMLQRQDDPDFWQSVTGTLELGELPVQTALREVKEETGIDIQQAKLELVDCCCANQYEIRDKWQHRYPAECKVNTEYVFSLQVKGDEAIVLTEHTNYLWLSKFAAMNKAWSQTNKLAIEQFVPAPDPNCEAS